MLDCVQSITNYANIFNTNFLISFYKPILLAMYDMPKRMQFCLTFKKFIHLYNTLQVTSRVFGRGWSITSVQEDTHMHTTKVLMTHNILYTTNKGNMPVKVEHPKHTVRNTR